MSKVTVVDDNPGYCLFLKEILTGKEFEVVGEAYDGKEAVRLVRDLRPELVVMDIEMPQMDGLEATGIIRSDAPGTAVVLISVNDEEEYHRQARAAGAVAFIPKTTFSLKRLLEELARPGR